MFQGLRHLLNVSPTVKIASAHGSLRIVARPGRSGKIQQIKDLPKPRDAAYGGAG